MNNFVNDVTEKAARSSDEWNQLLELVNVWLTQKAKVKLPVWLPPTSTLEMLLKHHLDIRAVLKKPPPEELCGAHHGGGG